MNIIHLIVYGIILPYLLGKVTGPISPDTAQMILGVTIGVLFSFVFLLAISNTASQKGTVPSGFYA